MKQSFPGDGITAFSPSLLELVSCLVSSSLSKLNTRVQRLTWTVKFIFTDEFGSTRVFSEDEGREYLEAHGGSSFSSRSQDSTPTAPRTY
jgi:hypothetical protein